MKKFVITLCIAMFSSFAFSQDAIEAEYLLSKIREEAKLVRNELLCFDFDRVMLRSRAMSRYENEVLVQIAFETRFTSGERDVEIVQDLFRLYSSKLQKMLSGIREKACKSF